MKTVYSLRSAAAATFFLALAGVAMGADEAATVEKLINSSVARVEQLTTDLNELSEEIEGRIEETVNHLASATDSNESGTAILNLKEKALDVIKEGIEMNDRRKRTLIAERAKPNPKLSKEELTELIARIDDRIELRKGQAVRLGLSLPVKDAEQEKYDEVYRKRGFRRYDRGFQINEDWKHNNKVAALSEQERRSMIKLAKQDIERQERRIATIKEQLKANSSEEMKELLEQDLGRAEGYQQNREEQLNALENPVAQAETQLSKDEAKGLEVAFDATVKDLEADVHRMLALENEINRANASIDSLRKRLKSIQ